MGSSFRRLFLDFAAGCRLVPRAGGMTALPGKSPGMDRLLERLLSWPDAAAYAPILKAALTDPYFPLGMLGKTLFAHVTGMRFYIDKDRPDLQPLLVRDLVEFAQAFLQIRKDLATLYRGMPLLSISLDGRIPHEPPSDQWCRMCGTCCQIGGVPAVAPKGVTYPPHWRELLEGTRLANQQLCPFLFQSPGSAHHFCSIHPIKPIACRAFDAEDCRARHRDGYLHGAVPKTSPLPAQKKSVE